MTDDAKSPASQLATAVLAKAHPARRAFWRLLVVGAALLLMAVSQGFAMADHPSLWPLVTGLFALAGATFFFGYGLFGVRVLPAIQLLNLALNQMTVGRYAIAETLLNQAEALSKAGVVRRTAELHRASIALGRGDPAAARAHVDAALAILPGPTQKLAYRLASFRAISLRALCKALGDDREGAERDIATVRQLARDGKFGATVIVGEAMLLDPLARAALAETILLARAGDNDALRRQLAEKRDLIIEGSLPRDRALLRGLERMLRSKAASPYREPPKRKIEGDEPEIEDWIERVLPEVAEFVPRLRRRTAGEPTLDERATAPAVARRVGIKAPSQPSRLRLLALIGALASIVVVAASQISSGGHSGARLSLFEEGSFSFLLASFPLIFGVMLFGILGVRLFRARRDRRELQKAFLDMAEGRRAEAEVALSALPKTADRSYQGLAALTLARSANRRGKLGEALDRAERGLAYTEHRNARAASSDIVHPELMTERAAALAGLGRTDEALSEAAALPTGFAFRARSLFRVRLLAFVASGNTIDAARLVAEQMGQIPLDPRTELCADLVRAVHSPEGVGVVEMQRIAEDVRVADNRAFLNAFAPTLLQEFVDRQTGLPGEIESLEASREALAVAEAEESEALGEARGHQRA